MKKIEHHQRHLHHQHLGVKLQNLKLQNLQHHLIVLLQDFIAIFQKHIVFLKVVKEITIKLAQMILKVLDHFLLPHHHQKAKVLNLRQVQFFKH